MLQQKDLQLQYEGFLQTPFLWYGKGVFDLQQFEITPSNTTTFTYPIEQKLRLGKLVERFVSFQLQQDKSIDILAENIQILNDKITLGELDCLLVKNNTPIHLEIVYKFYLYDSSVGNTELEHWIGPNRRDSFVQKLTKLTSKQLPLLHSSHCTQYLKQFNLSNKKIQQQVYFKAQLFVPLKDYKSSFPKINSNCIYGFYIDAKSLQQFSNGKFYIPNKHNWLIVPHTNVNWLTFNIFTEKIQPYLEEQNSPLCWLKQPNGELIKFFVVWW